MTQGLRPICLLVLVLLSPACGSMPERVLGPPVDNFALLDEKGDFHELRYDSDASAIVLFVQGVGCPIGRNLIPTVNQLHQEFGPRGVRFFGFNASPQDDRESVAREVAEFGLQFPVLMDEAQHIARSLEIDRTAEAIVIDPASWRIVYRVPVDDRLDYEVQKKEPSESYLRSALDGFLSGGPIPPSGPGPGCLIQLGGDAPEPVSYSETVAPILKQRCGECHRAGGVAPWALDSYRRVHGWSPMIREVLRTRRMPPWRIDPHVGDFPDLNLLTAEEERLIVSWIDGGSRHEGGPDPLREVEVSGGDEWKLGEPDLILDFEEQEVPATGVIPYRYVRSRLNNRENLWVRAIAVIPTNPQVVHHALVFLRDDGVNPLETFYDRVLGSYAPGLKPAVAPPDTAFFVPAESRLILQLHYTPSGRSTTNRIRMGLYLSSGPPQREYKVTAIEARDLVIPAGVRSVRITESKTFRRDVDLHTLRPHMHYRGRSVRIRARYPDRSSELLLHVPDYSFDWQAFYPMAEPRILPAGTVIEAEAIYDNSANNRFNPDPLQEATWGEQLDAEMFLVYLYYTERTGPSPQAP